MPGPGSGVRRLQQTRIARSTIKGIEREKKKAKRLSQRAKTLQQGARLQNAPIIQPEIGGSPEATTVKRVV